MTKTVVVLGTGGMLGSMVYGYLKRNPQLKVIGTDRTAFDAEKFAYNPESQTLPAADAIINCIGVIKPFCKDNDPVGVRRAIAINGMFPHRLGEYAKKKGIKAIQIATDCVYSGAKGAYVETDAHDALDVYGKTKSLGEVFDKSLLNIRCSIIGPEVKNKVSLLEWFLGNPAGAELNGFSHHRWNGVTTLQFAKLCEKIVLTDGIYDSLLATSPVHHFLPNTTVDKFELLNLMAKVFMKDVKVKRVDNIGPPVDRTIATKFNMLGELYPRGTMEAALTELQQYMSAT